MAKNCKDECEFLKTVQCTVLSHEMSKHICLVFAVTERKEYSLPCAREFIYTDKQFYDLSNSRQRFCEAKDLRELLK